MRTLQLSSPHMRGDDVKKLQEHINVRLRKWGLQHTLLDTDGEFGQTTARNARAVAWGLGLTNKALDRGITGYVQNLIANPNHLNAKQRQLASQRKDWRARYVKRLKGNGLDAAYRFAKSMIGVHEVPAGSNMGPHITEWERLTGYSPPPGVYWCGCTVNAILIAAGFQPQHFLGYVPSIEAHARGGLDGWSWHSPDATPQRGWIACFGEPIGEHTEWVAETGHPLRTIGGNTSAGDGSPNNGGEVAYHDFSKYHGLPLRGFAAPVYHH